MHGKGGLTARHGKGGLTALHGKGGLTALHGKGGLTALHGKGSCNATRRGEGQTDKAGGGMKGHPRAWAMTAASTQA
jgi:hypothetical protein